MRNVLITGAAARLGRAITEELHGDHRIVIHYRSSANAAHALAKALNKVCRDSAVALQSALDSADACADLARRAEEVWGGIDVLVNNASAFYPTPVGKATEEDWDQLVGSNLKAPFSSVKRWPKPSPAMEAALSIWRISMPSTQCANTYFTVPPRPGW